MNQRVPAQQLPGRRDHLEQRFFRSSFSQLQRSVSSLISSTTSCPLGRRSPDKVYHFVSEHLLTTFFRTLPLSSPESLISRSSTFDYLTAVAAS